MNTVFANNTPYMMRHGYGMDSPFFMISFGHIIFFLLLILLVYLIVKNSNINKDSDSSEEILKERFARGEITEEEFKKMRKVLRSR